MLTREELKKMFSFEGIECFEGALSTCEKTVFLKENSLEEIMKYAKVNNLKSVLYNFVYYDINRFYISSERMNKLQNDIYELIAQQIEEYNKKVASTDFSRVCGINVFCIYQGIIVSIHNDDLWAENEDLFFGERKLQILIESKNKEIIEIQEKMRKKNELQQAEKRKIQEEKRKEDELLLNELRKYILADIEFKNQIYPGFRRDYIRAIFAQRKETQIYRHLLFDQNDYDYVNMRKAVDFIEILWREKNNL